MANIYDGEKGLSETRTMNGRRLITSSANVIDRDNILYELGKAMNTHNLNANEIEYLWNYYRGEQPILHRTKDVRPEICNKIVENRANEIVSFKVGYLCGEPIQYVGRTGDETVSEDISFLNELMFAEDKASQDQEIVEWQMICGTAFRLVLPDEPEDVDEAPFELNTLDPRTTFIVYSSGIGHKPLMGVTYWTDNDDYQRHYSIYTPTEFFRIDGDIITEITPHALGCIPIFEYPANSARLGSFEVVLPLLDTINNIESNRMDGMEQTIQAFIKFINCDIDEESFASLREMGAIRVKSVDGQQADVDMVTNDLNQDQSQTYKEDLYNAVLTICGMPNRNGGSSTSDTGQAVLLRDGWSLAESRAKDSEHMFKKSEKQMLKLVLKICKDLAGLDLHLRDIDMRFTRRNYDNIQSKSQVLISMLNCDKIHPQLAFQGCGMFPDSESAYLLSMEYWEAQKQKTINELTTIAGVDYGDNV